MLQELSGHLPFSHYKTTWLHFLLFLKPSCLSQYRNTGYLGSDNTGYAADTSKPVPGSPSHKWTSCCQDPRQNRAFIAPTQLQVPNHALCRCSKASSWEPNHLHQPKPGSASVSALQAPARNNLPHKDYSISHPFQQNYPCHTALVQMHLKTQLRSSSS